MWSIGKRLSRKLKRKQIAQSTVLKPCLWQRLVVLQHSMTLFITVLHMPRTEVLTKLQISTKTNMVVLSFFVETMTNPQVRFIWKWHKNQPFTLASMIDRLPFWKLQMVLFSTVRKQLPFLIARMLLPSQSTKKHLLPAMLNLHSNKEPWQQSLLSLRVKVELKMVEYVLGTVRLWWHWVNQQKLIPQLCLLVMRLN